MPLRIPDPLRIPARLRVVATVGALAPLGPVVGDLDRLLTLREGVELLGGLAAEAARYPDVSEDVVWYFSAFKSGAPCAFSA